MKRGSWIGMFTTGIAFATGTVMTRSLINSGGMFGYKVRKLLYRWPWLDLNFRIRTAAAALPKSGWNRLRMAGFEIEELDLILRAITSVDLWVHEWTQVGINYLHRAEMAERKPELRAALLEKAAAAFHFTQLYGAMTPTERYHMRWLVRKTFAQSIRLFPEPVRTWTARFRRDITFRGYYRRPGSALKGLIILSNGLNFTKEEMHFYAKRFLRAKYGVVYYDDPVPANYEDVGVCLLDQARIIECILARVGRMDPATRGLPVGLWGASLGGWKVLMMAAFHPRVRACIALSPFFELDAYYDDLVPVVLDQFSAAYRIGFMTPERRRLFRQWLHRSGLRDKLRQINCPVFVLGGGHDQILPGRETLAIYDRLRSQKRLYYDPEGPHMLMDQLFRLWPKFIHYFNVHLAGSGS